ncbi:MAG TPA: hypothetical protein VLZ05_10210 [Mycobacterium sp.]|nr:hypothetical protein [Mycobacterium sp.]HUH69210.1 hypothetical protein [Mycobacterium sp.]
MEANEGIVEDSYERVEQLVISQFARQGPVAGELRFLLAVFRDHDHHASDPAQTHSPSAQTAAPPLIRAFWPYGLVTTAS